MSHGKVIATPLHLYRFLLRQCKKLPKNAADYYKHQVRQSFNSHADENNAERIQQIIKRAIEDSEWIVKQYSKERKKNL